MEPVFKMWNSRRLPALRLWVLRIFKAAAEGLPEDQMEVGFCSGNICWSLNHLAQPFLIDPTLSPPQI